VLHVEQHPFDRPVQHLPQHGRIALAPVGPAPHTIVVHGQRGGQERTVVVGEREAVLVLHRSEFRVGEAGCEAAAAQCRQPSRGIPQTGHPVPPSDIFIDP
jgi:hypothetical protein